MDLVPFVRRERAALMRILLGLALVPGRGVSAEAEDVPLPIMVVHPTHKALAETLKKHGLWEVRIGTSAGNVKEEGRLIIELGPPKTVPLP